MAFSAKRSATENENEYKQIDVNIAENPKITTYSQYKCAKIYKYI